MWSSAKSPWQSRIILSFRCPAFSRSANGSWRGALHLEEEREVSDSDRRLSRDGVLNLEGSKPIERDIRGLFRGKNGFRRNGRTTAKSGSLALSD